MFRKKVISAAMLCTALVSNWAVLAHAADPCDRACLEGYIDKVLAAMIAHNPNQLMLARDVYYTENGVQLRLGDGKIDQIEAVINGVPYAMKSDVWDR
jgi:hypothetical protein